MLHTSPLTSRVERLKSLRVHPCLMWTSDVTNTIASQHHTRALWLPCTFTKWPHIHKVTPHSISDPTFTKWPMFTSDPRSQSDPKMLQCIHLRSEKTAATVTMVETSRHRPSLKRACGILSTWYDVSKTSLPFRTPYIGGHEIVIWHRLFGSNATSAVSKAWFTYKRRKRFGKRRYSKTET